jgi:hypothetical protein
MNNMLWDPVAKRVSGIVDFDWSGVSHPIEEFFTSLGDLGGSTHAHPSADLARAVITGDFSSQPEPKPSDHQSDSSSSRMDAWDLARAWDQALHRSGGLRPSDVPGVQTLEWLRELRGLLAPFDLVTHAVLKARTPEQVAEKRAQTEDALRNVLDRLGA